jgi:D-inositol-3-phosphate glycosyltransferase
VKHDVRALLFVGRHVPVKGLDLLLAALPEVAAYQPRVRLLVAGGDAASAVEGDSAGRVTWLGPVARERLPLLYRSVDALVVPSRYESFGLVVLEALACGTPVIATRVGVVDEVVCDGVNGRRADVPAPDALARAILEQLESEPPSPAAIRDSVARWSWERTGMAIEGVYREVVEHGG